MSLCELCELCEGTSWSRVHENHQRDSEGVRVRGPDLGLRGSTVSTSRPVTSPQRLPYTPPIRSLLQRDAFATAEVGEEHKSTAAEGAQALVSPPPTPRDMGMVVSKATSVQGGGRLAVSERRTGSFDPRPPSARGFVVERTAEADCKRYMLACERHGAAQDFSVRVQNFGPHPLHQGECLTCGLSPPLMLGDVLAHMATARHPCTYEGGCDPANRGIRLL